MAEFIPTYNWTDFLKAAKLGQLHRLKSCEINFNGEYLFSFVNPQTDYIRLHVEQLALLGNALSGETLEDILTKEITAA